MVRPLEIRTGEAPGKKKPLSVGAGLLQFVAVGAQILIHTVPDGYRHELFLWAHNNDAANDGQVLFEFGGDANLSIIAPTENRAIIPRIIGNMVIEARSGDIEIDCLAITEPVIVWGYVLETSIEP